MNTYRIWLAEDRYITVKADKVVEGMNTVSFHNKIKDSLDQYTPIAIFMWSKIVGIQLEEIENENLHIV